ncbi:MAG: tetratricopeptide repeat protein [Spirochaetales bacterium]|nr:tetratricopeptide repeat protein [Spirochaetales bacterium]
MKKGTLMPSPLEEKKQQVLDTILYISIPEDMEGSFGDFPLDPRKMLPIEVTGDHEPWNIDELSWEMIVAGMLKILAYQPDHEDAGYYRAFVLAIKPELIAELTETAIFKANNGDFELSEEIFLALLGLQPSQQRPILNLALHYDKRSESLKNAGNESLAQFYEEQAFHWYKDVLDADEPLEEAYLYAGYFFVRIQNYGRALGSFESYLELGSDPEHKENIKKVIQTIKDQNLTDAQFKEAYDFILLSRETEAIEKINGFLTVHPEVWNGWFLKGWAQRRLGSFALALDSFKTCIEKGGENPDTLNEVAICQIELEQFSDALTSLYKALTFEPENIKIISNLGIVHLKLGEPEKAKGFFETVLEFDPEDPLALEFLEK